MTEDKNTHEMDNENVNEVSSKEPEWFIFTYKSWIDEKPKNKSIQDLHLHQLTPDQNEEQK